MAEKKAAEEAAEIWKELVEAAKEVSEDHSGLEFNAVKKYGRRLDKYIELCSGTPNLKEKVKWLTVNEKYHMDPSFYRRRIEQIEDELTGRALTSVSVTILCYRISERENCLPEDVCKTLIILGLFSKKTRTDKYILGELRSDDGKKGNSNSGQIKEGISNNQGDHDLPENSEGGAESPEDGLEDMSPQKNSIDDGAGLIIGNDKCKVEPIEGDIENIQPYVTQHTDKDSTLEITKEYLEKFVTDFIEEMSFRMETRFLKDPSSHSALFSICVDELSIFHPNIETWKYVWVTYFASDTTDEDVQQEIELIHKLEKCSDAFVIVACATDEIFRHVRENIACDRKNSIMLLCYEHQDEAYICLKKKPKSDKKSFEFFKPDSQKYYYM